MLSIDVIGYHITMHDRLSSRRYVIIADEFSAGAARAAPIKRSGKSGVSDVREKKK